MKSKTRKRKGLDVVFEIIRAIGVFMVVASVIGMVASKAWRRWRAEQDLHEIKKIDALIAKSGYTYKYSQADEDLRKRTETRRRAAESIRNRAAQVETGAPVAQVLRRVKLPKPSSASIRAYLAGWR